MQMRKKNEWADKLYSTLAGLSANDKNHILFSIKNQLDVNVRDIRFRKGAMAPEFILCDLLGKAYHLADFKGKMVYMDLWATWCPHCIELEDDWNNLAKSYSGNPDIVFLSVSLDDKVDTWKQYIKKRPLEGILTHGGDGGLNGIFGKSYDIQSLPHFILLDGDGKILQYDAPRPSSPESLRPFFRVKN
jgi:thiol-disulfide isomerase/thioredoxin